MRHPIRSRLRDLYARLGRRAARNQTAPVPPHPSSSDGDTEWQILLPVQSPSYRAMRVGSNGVYRGHRVGFDNSPGPRPRAGGRVPL